MPLLKICGNHLIEDLYTLNESIENVDYIGFIFTEISKRFVTPEKNKGMAKRVSFHK